jgi:polar amino acid transport system substrate-binding protein
MRRIFPGLLMLAALSWTGSAQAARPLVFAFDEMLPMKTVENGSFGGAYTEIVRELARRTRLQLEIKTCPLKRCLFMLEQGEADIIIGLRETPERARYLRFLRTPYRDHSSDRVFYVQKGHGVVIRDYPDLLPLRIGVKLGAAYFERFDSDQQLQKDAVKDMEINFRKLSLGRLDAVFIPEDQGEALLAHLRLGELIEKADYRITDATARFIALSRKSPLLAQAESFERAMKDMVRDGTLAALYKRYYYDAYQVAPNAVQIK